MGLFQNDFFSAAGQAERWANVGSTLLAAVGIKKGGVTSNTGVKAVDVALSAVASHPFIAAGVVAGAVNPAGAGAAIKAAGKAAASEFGKLSLGGKVASVVAAPVVGSALITSSKLRGAALDAPSSLAQFGANIGELAENPSLQNLSDIAKENPILSAATAGAGLLAVGAAGRGVAGIVATSLNTKAIRESTAGQSNLTQLYPNSVAGKSALVAPATDSSIKTPTIPAQKGAKTPSKRRKKAKESPRISQSVKVYNIDDRDVSDRKVFKKGGQYR